MKKRTKEVKIITILALLGLVVLLLILSLAVNKKENKKVEAKEVECEKNSDCIIVRSDCCPCEEGKNPVCIPKTRLFEFSSILEKCSQRFGCMNENCGKISCSCINNKCIGQKI